MRLTVGGQGSLTWAERETKVVSTNNTVSVILYVFYVYSIPNHVTRVRPQVVCFSIKKDPLQGGGGYKTGGGASEVVSL